MKISFSRFSLFIFSFASFYAPLSAHSFEETYIGAGAIAVMPQGGSKLRHRAGASANVGAYLNGTISAELEAGALEGQSMLAARSLFHIQGIWEEFGLLFGYERFDPFLSLGARGFIGGAKGDVGPSAGLGAMYYLTDDWALRFDADASVGLDSTPKGVYSVSAGIRYSF